MFEVKLPKLTITHEFDGTKITIEASPQGIEEDISTFILYLRSAGYSNDTIKDWLLSTVEDLL